jgi:hypothetical protein
MRLFRTGYSSINRGVNLRLKRDQTSVVYAILPLAGEPCRRLGVNFIGSQQRLSTESFPPPTRDNSSKTHIASHPFWYLGTLEYGINDYDVQFIIRQRQPPFITISVTPARRRRTPQWQWHLQPRWAPPISHPFQGDLLPAKHIRHLQFDLT